MDIYGFHPPSLRTPGEAPAGARSSHGRKPVGDSLGSVPE